MTVLGSARLSTVAAVMALLDVKGVGPAGVNDAREKLGSLEQLVAFLHGDVPHPSPSLDRIRRAWQEVDLQRYLRALDDLVSKGSDIVCVGEPGYPKNLGGVRSAPPILYVRGSLQRLNPRALALVGATDPTERGKARARRLARLCTEAGIQVISGLARGIDGESHRASVEAGAPTFAVLGHGLDHMFPPEHRALADQIVETGGALISQFPPEVGPSRWTFPARNELMCTIASGTVIVEIERTDKLGSVIQARFSIKHGRPVFVLRSNITELRSPDAQALVDSGDAVLVSDFSDVLENLQVGNDTFRDKAPQPTLFDGKASGSPRRAVLFDLDGVLYNPRPVLEQAYCASIMEVTGTSVTPSDLAGLLHLSPPKVFKKFGAPYQETNSVFNRHYQKVVGEVDCIFAAVVDLAREAKARGAAVGVVTSQPRNRYEHIAKRAALGDVVDVSITWNDIPRDRQKPHPDGLLRAAERLGVDPRSAIYIGDSPTDVQAARNARMKSVAVLWGLSLADALMKFSPDWVVANPAELSEILAEFTR